MVKPVALACRYPLLPVPHRLRSFDHQKTSMPMEASRKQGAVYFALTSKPPAAIHLVFTELAAHAQIMRQTFGTLHMQGTLY
jgi:hypothetical protein